MYKLFLCLRYLRKRHMVFFAIAAVTLCTAMVLIVISVMGGFLDMVKDRSRGLLGDIIVDGPYQGFPYYQEFIDVELKAGMADRIHEATPVIYTAGLLRMRQATMMPVEEADYVPYFTRMVRIIGLRLDEAVRVSAFGVSLYYNQYYPGTTTFAEQPQPLLIRDPDGSLHLPEDQRRALQTYLGQADKAERAALQSKPAPPGEWKPPPTDPDAENDALPGVVIGVDIVARREKDATYTRLYPRGHEVQLTVMPLRTTGGLSMGGALTPFARYVDDSRTGIYDIDSVCVYVDFAILQNWLDMHAEGDSPARATQIQIKLRDGVDAAAAKAEIIERWSTFRSKCFAEGREDWTLVASVYDEDIRTWEEKQGTFIAAVKKEKALVTTLFAVISVVAVFLVGCVFYMIVQEKTRDIGILKSVGASAAGVASIFLMYGTAVGVVGAAAGSTIGYFFVRHINDVQDFIAAIHPDARIWSPEIYAFDRIPNQVKLGDLIIIAGVAIVSSMLGSLWAGWRASRIWPVEALRYE